jgi:hypothetical protein
VPEAPHIPHARQAAAQSCSWGRVASGGCWPLLLLLLLLLLLGLLLLGLLWLWLLLLRLLLLPPACLPLRRWLGNKAAIQSRAIDKVEVT